MSMIFDQEARADRARDLAAQGCNGIARVFVSLDAADPPAFAWLEVEFHNALGLAPLPAAARFSLSGGVRLRGAADGGPVRVTAVQAGTRPESLRLRVTPVGDYAGYTLATTLPVIDPLFSRIDFKFRPGCFNMNCQPAGQGVARSRSPVIDYLARDYDSFRHVLITAMMERVPDWQPTSEADLDQVLIDLIAAEADLLADFHDRTMNERYWGLARKRVALARYGRLMDYHIHQGNQADTWLALLVDADVVLPAPFGVWAGAAYDHPEAVVFASEHAAACYKAVNSLQLYTWGDSVTALEAGATQADLTAGPAMTLLAAQALAACFNSKGVERLLLQQERNPETGRVNGRDSGARQILRLLPVAGMPARAEALRDPVTGDHYVRVRWLPEDRLQRRYCFVTECSGSRITDLALFYGNLLRVSQGRPWKTVFRAPGATLGVGDPKPLQGTDEAYYEPTPWGVLCALSRGPLAYRDTPPGGEQPTRSSLTVQVGGYAQPWQEQSDLIESDGAADHFIVETDEQEQSWIRFGNGSNGRSLPEQAVVEAIYRVGQGVAGNVGADTLTAFDSKSFPQVERLWNPLDVTNGRAPEAVDVLRRRVPEAYRRRQRRAVTLADYATAAESVAGVAHARARYAWTGSYRTVRVVVDPQGSNSLSDSLRLRLQRTLDALRLIGEDVEIRLAQYAALDVALSVCIDAGYWPEDVRALLAEEFCASYTRDGRSGFFHPDAWTFGQALYASQLIGRALGVAGVARVLRVSIRRWHSGSRYLGPKLVIQPEDLPQSEVELFAVEPFEIIRVDNDPSRLEFGRITFDLTGGRR